MISDAERKVRAMKREAVTVEVIVDPATGAWELRAPDGLVVGRGEATREGERLTCRVPLGYDGSAYFDALSDRRRARIRADRLRTALADIAGAEDLDEAREIACVALESPLETAVREEQEEDDV
jgi:hypothetical protein